MNFLVQSLIQDLENMGRFAHAVSVKEWQDKWTALSQVTAEEREALKEACEKNTHRKKAWDLVQANDPDPAKTQRKAAFEALFKV